MGPDHGRTGRLPIVPLPKDTVLLPGVTLRIPLSNRPDIANLLSTLLGRATLQRDRASLTLACVPLNSRYLSKDGRQIPDAGKPEGPQTEEQEYADASQADENDLFKYGTLAKLIGIQGRGYAEPYLVVIGVRRFTLVTVLKERPFIEAEVSIHDEPVPTSDDIEVVNLFQYLKQLSRELLILLRLASLLPAAASSLSPIVARRFELFISKKDLSQAGSLADFMVDVVESSFEEKLQVLSAVDIKDRLEKVVELLSRQVQSIKSNVRITSITATTLPPALGFDISQLDPQQRELLARRAMTGINGILPPGMANGRSDEAEKEPNEIDEVQQRLDNAQLSLEAQKVADRELKRLRKMNPANAEYGVCRSYLENLAEIPWTKVTQDEFGADTLQRARKQLDDDHYGLEKIKKRVLEYLAVLKLKQSVNEEVDQQISEIAVKLATPTSNSKGTLLTSDPERDVLETKLEVLKSKRTGEKPPILLLVGPPGTGKTSLAKSVATSLGRKFHRISLGGVRDEAEIRGHRRTYVAAMPGLIVSGLKKVGVGNPVFLLDEIDKVGGSNFHGDPSAAMLEVLDPEQNHTFTDHYIGVPIDLSKVLFIATANSLDTIPPPLLDRMETIALPGYTTIEKKYIAKQHLIPKQARINGLLKSQVIIPDDVIEKIILSYTRESGVRSLERAIGSVCRCKAVQYVDAKDTAQLETYNPNVFLGDLEDILGIEQFDEEIAEKNSRPGIVTGLVAYSTGGQGSILFIEVADMPGNGRVQLTGKLGDVLKESVEVALTWVKAHSFELGLTHDPNEDIMKNRSLHVHCPSGAIPKDGPSAGLAHSIALISLFSGKAVPPQIAMTGEVSLRGRVMPVGGIKEKLIGALRAGVKSVLLPYANRKDVKDVPNEVQEGLEIIYIKHIWDAVRHIWPHAHWPGQHHMGVFESRL